MTIEVGFLMIGLGIGTLIGLTFGYIAFKTEVKHPIMFDERKYNKILSDTKRQEQRALEISLR
jgi:hypothetical protein